MISFIVYVLFVVFIISLIVHNWYDIDGEALLVIILAVLFLGILIVGVPHIFAKECSIKPDNISYIDDLYVTRTDVENDIDIDNITADNLKEISKYNKGVNAGNNYWCRFKLEDRSDYLIDYDYYFALYKKQQEDKLKTSVTSVIEPEHTIYYPDEEYWNRAKSEI